MRILIWIKRIWSFRRDPARGRDIMIRRAGLCRNRRNHHVRAERPQIARLFHRGFVGHHKDALVASDRRGDRQTDAGVPRSRFHDRAAPLQNSGALSRVNHRDADTILYREAWIEILHLGENQRLQSLVQTIEFDQRSMADQAEHVFVIVHVCFGLTSIYQPARNEKPLSAKTACIANSGRASCALAGLECADLSALSKPATCRREPGDHGFPRAATSRGH